MFLVTGGAGFIGSHVVAELNARGHSDILIVDDLMDGRKCMNLVGRKFSDYMDWRVLFHSKTAPANIEAIIHLGAISDTLFTNGKILMEQNYEFSKQMFRLAMDARCTFVYASSASVYGDGVIGFSEEPECEQPKTPYAVSKWMFDQFIRRRNAEFDKDVRQSIPVSGMRYFNVYGPGEAHKSTMASFAYKCFSAVTSGAPIMLFEGSDQIMRDFIYVTDAAKFTVDCLMEDVVGIINVGTGVARSFLAVAEEVKRHFPSAEIVTTPFPETMLPGYQRHTRAHMGNLRGWLGESNVNPLTLADGIALYRKEFSSAV